MPMLTRAPPTRVIRSSACCEGSDCRTFALLFVQPARATATPCKATFELYPRSLATIGFWAAQASSRRRNWRALAANGRDTQTLLLTSTAENRETVVGEARVALSCAERTGEFGMSIADDWRRLGVGSTLLEDIERKAAADGIEWLLGDTLLTNEGMIALARSRGFRLGAGIEPRLLRIQKRLEDPAPDVPCRKWAEIAGGANSWRRAH